MELGKIAIGGAVAALVTAALERIDPKLAWWFVVITFLTVIVVQREIFFTQLNAIGATLRGVK